MARLLYSIVLSFVLSSNSAQFIDLNLFKPRLIVEGEFVHQTSDSSLSYWNSGFNYVFPIKSKLGLKVDWGGVILSGSIKEAVQKVQPKAYQIFGNFGASYQDFSNPVAFGNFQSLKGGISGIYATVKKKKLRSFLFGSSVRITQTPSLPSNIGINPSIFLGSAFATNLKSFWVVGAYGSYYGNRVVGAPVIAHYRMLLPKLTLLMVLPVQIKLSWRKNKKFVQSLALSYFGDNFRLSYQDPSSGISDNGTYFSTGLRFSTQSKIKLGKKTHLYLDLGWHEAARVGEINGYKNSPLKNYSGSFYSKIRLNIPMGKALLNSESFDFGL